jgi:hypothetical protein
LAIQHPLYDAAIRRLSLRHKEDSMVVRFYAVACIALASLLLGGTGIARAGDDYSSPQAGDSYSPPDAGEQPAQPDAAPTPEDDSATAPDDNGGGDSGDDAPPPSDQPE